MSLNELLDLIAFIIFVICVSVFTVGLIYKMKRPTWGERGFLNIMYGLWVKRMIDAKETINAVQTMRNLIMVVTFLSSSMLLLLGLLLQSPYVGANGLLYPSTSLSIFEHYKLMLFVVVIVFSVTMFLLSLRQMVRFSILIGISSESIKNISDEYQLLHKNKIKNAGNVCYYVDAERLKRDAFLRAMNRFTFGMRAVFYGIGITLWFVNVYAFIIGTVSLTLYLIIHHDAEPCHKEELPL